MSRPILALIIVASSFFVHNDAKSAKKGVCIPPGEHFFCGDLAAFKNVSWWYNWHVTPNHEREPHEDYCTCDTGGCGPVPQGKEFIPLIWGADASDQPWHSDISDPVENKYDTILGFNEPNRGFRGPDMSPEEAAAAWIEIQTLYPDKILVSPAPAGGNLKWFDGFFDACESLGCRVDYLATHNYHGEVDLVMEELENLFLRYGRKIWLTEFAVANTHDKQKVLDFVKGIIPRLEAADFIHRYAWFITRGNDKGDEGWYRDKYINDLFLEDSAELSEVGKLYDML